MRARRPHMHLVLQPPLQRLAVLGIQPHWVLVARRENERAHFLASLAAGWASRQVVEGEHSLIWWCARSTHA
eukprot:14236698-Alexandrium_andersonii.AAC.1